MEYTLVKLHFPSIYNSCYQTVAHSLAAKYTYFNRSDKFSEKIVETTIQELFESCKLIDVNQEMIVYTWFRRCCSFAVENMSIVINDFATQN